MIAFFGFMFAAAVAQGPDRDAAQDLSDRAHQLYDAARYTEAEPLYREAVDAWGRLGPAAAQDRAIDLRNLGALLRATGRYREAEPVLTESLRELEDTGADTREVERALLNLAALYRSAGDLLKAESYALRADGFIEKRPGVPGPERQGPRLILASIYLEQRRYREAERILNDALKGADARSR